MLDTETVSIREKLALFRSLCDSMELTLVADSWTVECFVKIFRLAVKLEPSFRAFSRGDKSAARWKVSLLRLLNTQPLNIGPLLVKTLVFSLKPSSLVLSLF